MSYFNGKGAVVRPPKAPVIPNNLLVTYSVFQSQGSILDRNCLVLVFLLDLISTFDRAPTVSEYCMRF